MLLFQTSSPEKDTPVPRSTHLIETSLRVEPESEYDKNSLLYDNLMSLAVLQKDVPVSRRDHLKGSVVD